MSPHHLAANKAFLLTFSNSGGGLFPLQRFDKAQTAFRVIVSLVDVVRSLNRELPGIITLDMEAEGTKRIKTKTFSSGSAQEDTLSHHQKSSDTKCSVWAQSPVGWGVRLSPDWHQEQQNQPFGTKPDFSRAGMKINYCQSNESSGLTESHYQVLREVVWETWSYSNPQKNPTTQAESRSRGTPCEGAAPASPPEQCEGILSRESHSSEPEVWFPGISHCQGICYPGTRGLPELLLTLIREEEWHS